jgi:CarboxypepD_reg-like domain
MLSNKTVLLLLTISIMLFSYTDIHQLVPAVIEGSVVNSKTGSPVSGAHAYIVLGEEEVLTSAKGEYRITTWQSLPVILTITNKNYETVQIKISDPSKKQLIKLQQK